MRFNARHWLLLTLACAVASGVGTGAHLAIAPWAIGTATARVLAAFAISALLDALAMWLVLRWSLAALRLLPWLLATGLGHLLALAISLPAAALVAPPRGAGLAQGGGYPPSLLAWIAMIAASATALLPRGLLLQRLSSASAVPFVAAGVIWMILGNLIGPAATNVVHRYIWWLALSNSGPSTLMGALLLPLAGSLVWGALSGLTMGAGLFLMARRPDRSATAP